MTRFGWSVSIGFVVVVLGIGLLIFGRPTTPSPVADIPKTPIVEPTPTPEPQTPITQVEYDKPISMSIGGKVAFADGLGLELKEINDSRCKIGVQCIWEGELSPVLSVSVSSSTLPALVRLGTVNNKSLTLKDYKLTLSVATEKAISILVSKVPVATTN